MYNTPHQLTNQLRDQTMTKIKQTFTFKGQGELLFVWMTVGIVVIGILGSIGH